MPLQVGEIVEGKVTDIMDYGVFVKLEGNKSGLVHISEVSREYVKDIHDVIKVGDEVKVKILSMEDNGKISLSIKKALPREERHSRPNDFQPKKSQEPLTLDDMLTKFLKDSDERQLDLKRNIEGKRGSSRRR
ncbi:MAG: S1 RNA-binding domain-containing protein [Clostridia bacterium]|nr:S1 RNA-binding domain-containing protein [Clostridia bacterium]